MIHLEHLLNATNGFLRYRGKQSSFDGFNHDSRQLIPGEMFVAVRGGYGDGHYYLLDALRGGATGLLVDAGAIASISEETRASLEFAGVATVVVEDTRIVF